MSLYLLSFVLALTAALVATPVARRAAIRLDIVDHPSARKVHVSPVPYLGGVAIYLAFAAILLLDRDSLLHSSGVAKATSQLFAIVIGASLMALLGLLDDRFGLPPLLKLAVQLLGALILVLAQVTVQLNHFQWLEAPLTILWVVGITNAFNLMDNMDGLAVGTAGIAACFFFLHAIMAITTQTLVASLAAALAGACFGFLFYNWSPAKIFMGDAGSLFLGYLLAALALKLTLAPITPQVSQIARALGYPVGSGTHAIALLAPIFVLGLPIFDTTLVTLSRLRRGVPISQGGRDHTSHRLVAAGMSHREAVMTLYLAGCALGGVSIVLTHATITEGALVSLLALILAGALFVRLERLYYAHSQPQPQPAEPTS
ncbi:MAG TPA: MraY family glycosyltransferase [Chloroflexota bacterium]|nr:MraY family glycosyltransferase [Chloroflexota bacterium]